MVFQRKLHIGQYNTQYNYDERGNITKLKRKGKTSNQNCAFGTIDNLVYMYDANSNKLAKIFDTTCEDGIYVNPITATNYNAGYIISDAKTNTFSGNTNNGPVKFNAGTHITLKGGFEYNTTGISEFSATINPCAHKAATATMPMVTLRETVKSNSAFFTTT